MEPSVAAIGLLIRGAALALATLGLFAGLSFWGEALWFEQVGYGDRFWKVVAVRVELRAAGALVGGALVLRWRANAGRLRSARCSGSCGGRRRGKRDSR